MKKFLSAAIVCALAVTMAFAVTGCGSENKSSSNDSSIATTTKPAATQATTKAAEKTTTTAASGAQQSGTGTVYNAPRAVVQAALNYYGASEANGDSVSINGTEKTSDGSVFFSLYVNMNGNAYPLFVSEDGGAVYEPEEFNAVYGITSQDTTSAAEETTGDENSDNGEADDSSNTEFDGDPDDYDDGYDYGGGPDHAEP